MDLASVLAGITVADVTGPVLVVGLGWVLHRSEQSYQHLARMNGDLKAMKQWKEDQEKLCNERHRSGPRR